MVENNNWICQGNTAVTCDVTNEIFIGECFYGCGIDGIEPDPGCNSPP